MVNISWLLKYVDSFQCQQQPDNIALDQEKEIDRVGVTATHGHINVQFYIFIARGLSLHLA